VQLEGAYDASGQPSPHVLTLGAWNAALETGVASPLDDAIANACRADLVGVVKRGEIPFDFVRKRVTVIVTTGRGMQLITKGAVPQVLEVCAHAGDGGLLGAGARGHHAALRGMDWPRHPGAGGGQPGRRRAAGLRS
jgi:Mg2+-importing ATPase